MLVAVDVVDAAHRRPEVSASQLIRSILAPLERWKWATRLRARVRVSLATVYNTLKQFMDAGLLREVVVDPGRSYFDTNLTDHHHFFHEKSNLLVDIPGQQLIVSNIPELPAGTAIERIDVVIRVNDV